MSDQLNEGNEGEGIGVGVVVQQPSLEELELRKAAEDFSRQLRGRFFWLFAGTFGFGFAFVITAASTTLYMNYRLATQVQEPPQQSAVDTFGQQFLFQLQQAQNTSKNQIFFIRLLQVSLGMVIGFFSCFLGVLVAWMGIHENYEFRGEGQGFKIALVSASPGIFLILCGAVIVCVCIFNPVRSEELQTPLFPMFAPAAVPLSSAGPVENLRSQVQDYQTEIDQLIGDIERESQSLPNASPPKPSTTPLPGPDLPLEAPDAGHDVSSEDSNSQDVTLLLEELREADNRLQQFKACLQACIENG